MWKQYFSGKAKTGLGTLTDVKKLSVLIVLTILHTVNAAEDSGAESPSEKAACYVVRSDNIAVKLSAQGEIVGLILGNRKIQRPFYGRTLLVGCSIREEVDSLVLDDGGVRFKKTLSSSNSEDQCLLIERFLPAINSVRWEIEVAGLGQPWSTPIETHISWLNEVDARFWTTWGDSRPVTHVSDWNDPLVPTPFDNLTLWYGAAKWDRCDAFCIPIATVLEPAGDIAFSLVQSPEDLLLDVRLKTTRSGNIILSRINHRIAQRQPVCFAMDLIAHPADWRCGLGWMVKRYPQFFNPPNLLTYEIAGCGAYSAYEGNLDVEKFRRMSFRVNWKASFDFPYMGMFLPPVGDKQQWLSFNGEKTSISRMRQYSQRIRQMGFYVLNYFNVTEFGNYIKYPPPPRKAETDETLWRDPNDFLYYKLRDAILLNKDSRPFYSWRGDIAMDPGEPVYQRFLLEQAQRHVEEFKDSSGICIDRMDWIQKYNYRRDDNVSWVDDKPAGSLIVSWHDIMSKLGPIMHRADKVIYCNPHYRRIDLLGYSDGIYDEFGHHPHSLNLCAMLAVRKPVIAWTVGLEQLRGTNQLHINPDAYFQRHLYMGAYLTVPFPGNHHSILPSDSLEKYYFDYGPLLDAIRGKKWVLLPHVIQVQNQEAKANIFEVPGGYVIPVIFGPEKSTVKIVLRNLPGATKQKKFSAEAIHPGTTKWAPVKLAKSDDQLILDVPLKRGCAMVRLMSLEKKDS
jgi:hypothetical protein